MALNLIILDTCVFIKAFRGDKATATIIKNLEGQIAYSYITYLELLAGCKTNMRKKEITGLFDTFYGIPVDYNISNQAVELMLKYISGQRSISIPDCLIAASQLTTGFPLFTYNTKDFEFFDNIHLLDLKDYQK